MGASDARRNPRAVAGARDVNTRLRSFACKCFEVGPVPSKRASDRGEYDEDPDHHEQDSETRFRQVIEEPAHPQIGTGQNERVHDLSYVHIAQQEFI